jgi:hypothetical protein
MRRRRGIKKQKNTIKKKLLQRKNHLMDVKTQLQTILQLLKQEEQELILMENNMVKKLKFDDDIGNSKQSESDSEKKELSTISKHN